MLVPVTSSEMKRALNEKKRKAEAAHGVAGGRDRPRRRSCCTGPQEIVPTVGGVWPSKLARKAQRENIGNRESCVSLPAQHHGDLAGAETFHTLGLRFSATPGFICSRKPERVAAWPSRPYGRQGVCG